MRIAYHMHSTHSTASGYGQYSVLYILPQANPRTSHLVQSTTSVNCSYPRLGWQAEKGLAAGRTVHDSRRTPAKNPT